MQISRMPRCLVYDANVQTKLNRSDLDHTYKNEVGTKRNALVWKKCSNDLVILLN